jgi:hypothetical protein
MIESEVAEVNIGELSRAKMFAELSEGNEDDVAELAVAISRFGDRARVSCDSDEAIGPSCGGGPTPCNDRHVRGKAGLLEELAAAGVGYILSWFNQSAGQLVENAVWSRPVLPGEDDLVVACNREDRDGALVTEDVPFGVTTVRKAIPTGYDA